MHAWPLVGFPICRRPLSRLRTTHRNAEERGDKTCCAIPGAEILARGRCGNRNPRVIRGSEGSSRFR